MVKISGIFRSEQCEKVDVIFEKHRNLILWIFLVLLLQQQPSLAKLQIEYFLISQDAVLIEIK